MGRARQCQWAFFSQTVTQAQPTYIRLDCELGPRPWFKHQNPAESGLHLFRPNPGAILLCLVQIRIPRFVATGKHTANVNWLKHTHGKCGLAETLFRFQLAIKQVPVHVCPD